MGGQNATPSSGSSVGMPSTTDNKGVSSPMSFGVDGFNPSSGFGGMNQQSMQNTSMYNTSSLFGDMNQQSTQTPQGSQSMQSQASYNPYQPPQQPFQTSPFAGLSPEQGLDMYHAIYDLRALNGGQSTDFNMYHDHRPWLGASSAVQMLPSQQDAQQQQQNQQQSAPPTFVNPWEKPYYDGGQ